MNAQELLEHYAAVKRRLSGGVTGAIPRTQIDLNNQPIKAKRSKLSKQSELCSGLPNIPQEVRSSIAQMLLAYDVSWKDVVSESRRREFVLCRRAISWALHVRGWSYPKIAALFGFDHSTVIYAVRSVNKFSTHPTFGTIKKNKAGWSGEKLDIPVLRGQMMKDIKHILDKHNVTWTRLLAERMSLDVTRCRREMVLFLYKKKWPKSKIGKFLDMPRSSVFYYIETSRKRGEIN